MEGGREGGAISLCIDRSSHQYMDGHGDGDKQTDSQTDQLVAYKAKTKRKGNMTNSKPTKPAVCL